MANKKLVALAFDTRRRRTRRGQRQEIERAIIECARDRFVFGREIRDVIQPSNAIKPWRSKTYAMLAWRLRRDPIMNRLYRELQVWRMFREELGRIIGELVRHADSGKGGEFRTERLFEHMDELEVSKEVRELVDTNLAKVEKNRRLAKINCMDIYLLQPFDHDVPFEEYQLLTKRDLDAITIQQNSPLAFAICEPVRPGYREWCWTRIGKYRVRAMSPEEKQTAEREDRLWFIDTNAEPYREQGRWPAESIYHRDT